MQDSGGVLFYSGSQLIVLWLEEGVFLNLLAAKPKLGFIGSSLFEIDAT